MGVIRTIYIHWDDPPSRPAVGEDLGKKVVDSQANCFFGLSSWWFQRFFIFPPTWGNDPI